MRLYKEILDEMNNAHKRYKELEKELEEFQNNCKHDGTKTNRVSMSCGYVSRTAFCDLCGKMSYLPKQPGDDP